jgi:hypothetical protein
MSNTSPRSLFLKRRGRGSASGQRAYSSGVKSSVSIRNLASLIECAISQEAAEQARGQAAHRQRAERAH